MNFTIFSILALSTFMDPGASEGEQALPIKEAQVALDKGNFEEAMKLLKEAASAGNAAAAFAVGDLYLTGKGTNASLPKAVEWYKMAAEKGHGNAMLRLGQIYHQGGEGLKKDETRASFYLQGAAEAGIAQAWSKLGQISELSARITDEEPDRKKLYSEARDYYQKGAVAGDHESQLLLGQILTNPDTEEVDLKESLEWLRKSAMAGNPNAMNEVGMRIQEGKGVEADPVAALGWYLVAAERKLPVAMTNLGICYANGIGVPVDYGKAGAWYDRAAKQNFALAQFLIGQLYENGQGTEPKPVYAFTQYSRAAHSGFQLAIDARDALKPKLSEEQLKEAEALLSQKPDK